MKKAIKIIAGACLVLAPAVTQAQSLSVSPTRLEVPNKGSQTTLTVKAEGGGTAVLQMRVMSWKEGQDPSRMKPTRDVVISPPIAKLKPRQELTVRVVRTKKRAVRKRECYRVLVDRLPGRPVKGQVVKLQVRHSLPLCFTS
ncbi:fimbria/pilus periplasmic chaperone [Amylibacter sp. IMCC11727]|uniref:fimbrial biogenesis chaperone n=1 Tax=Amylibacter sp. IMCC11727 TaxID=3039851 RepID=UPI00244E4AF2|nr:fimbria/pilus periplasmic chaperone [Amylibacter sp. IMCC11727]WGI22685.1 fimbria/pilus periplasmic chaperone [Amylibacter sp. IMCC11727]